jgi:hypothetical protein
MWEQAIVWGGAILKTAAFFGVVYAAIKVSDWASKDRW